MILQKQQIKQLEFYFYNEKRIATAVKFARLEQDAHKPNVRTNKAISDPTAMTAIRHIMPIKFVFLTEGLFTTRVKHPEKWLDVIAKTYRQFEGQLAGELAQRRYRLNEKPDFTADNMRIGQRTYYDWRDDFILQAMLFAVAENLMKPCE